jgi:glycosyltransferase involved in cell wall biosynthesis
VDYDQIAVFVPAFNEGETIGKQLGRIIDTTCGRLGMLVVVDDGSSDGTAGIARRFTRHVIERKINGGNGTATKTALSYIADRPLPPKAVIRMDADGQHDPSLLGKALDGLSRRYDVVVASRFHPESITGHAMLDRKALNRSIASMVSDVSGWPVTDARSGFFAYSWRCIAPVIARLRVEKYGIPIELLLRVRAECPGARYIEFPHPARYEAGISRRLDRKYAEEDINAKVSRMTEAYRVFLATCADLGLA